MIVIYISIVLILGYFLLLHRVLVLKKMKREIAKICENQQFSWQIHPIYLDDNVEILIFNPQNLTSYVGKDKYKENRKEKKLKQIEKILAKSPNQQHIFVLSQQPIQIKAYINESEIKIIKENEIIHKFKFIYFSDKMSKEDFLEF